MASNEKEKKEGEEEQSGEGEQEAGKGSAKKKLIIIVLAVVLLLGGGGGAGLYFSGVLGGKDEAAEGEDGEGEEKSGEEAKGGKGHEGKDGKEGKAATGPAYYDLGEFLVNLNSGGKQVHFLKMSVTLELAPSEGGEAAVKAAEPRIRDNFQIYLRELRSEDLEGSAGIQRLREELLLRLNKILQPAKVNDILFKEIIVQ